MLRGKQSKKTLYVVIASMLLAGPVYAKNENAGNAKANNAEIMCNDQIASPSKLTIPVGKSTLITLPEPLKSRTVARDEVAQAKLISARTLYLVGLDMGSTNMIIQGQSGACTVIDITVGMDPTPLQDTLKALLPDEKNIVVTAASEALILSGTVSSSPVAKQAIDIAQAFVQREFYEVKSLDLESNENWKRTKAGQYSLKPNPRVVNLLSVGAQQQVMLEVKVAEVSKTLLDQLGASLSLTQTSGGWTYGIFTDFLSTTASATGGALSIFKNASKNLIIDAEKRDGLIKVLAEPSIMAISGQEGSFLAGGTIFIPVAQNVAGNNNLVTLEEKEFGVGVKFTPTVLAGGRINLQVAPEVSELNREGVGISATGFAGTAIFPAFTTRRASTTVQLMDGQSFAIGGLIKNNTTTNINAFPVLGEIPILGTLFRSTEFQKDKSELIFIVTPHLVKPLAPKDIKLPTDSYTEPSRKDLFLKGKMEGPAPEETTNSTMMNNTLSESTEIGDTGFDVK